MKLNNAALRTSAGGPVEWKRLPWLRLLLLVALVALALFVAPRTAHAAARTASVSGNWSNTATWGGLSVPVAGDTCSVNAGITVTVDTAAVCSTLVFTAGATGNTVTISGSNSLTISGAITLNGTTAGSGTQPTLLNVGAGTLSAASIALIPNASNLGSNNRRSQLTISTGTATVTGSITTPNVTAGTGTGVLFTGGGTLDIGGALMGDGDALFTPSTGTVNYNGSGAQTVSTYTYNNLTISGSNTKTLAANTTIGGNLTVSSGILNLSTFTANRSSAGGTLTVSDGATLQIGGASNFPTNYSTVTLGTSSTVEYNRAGVQTVSDRDYGNLILSGSGTKTWTRGAARTVNGNLTVSGTAAFTLNGNFTLNIGGDWTYTSSGAFTTAANAASIVNFNRNGTSNLEKGGVSTVGTETFCNLTISSATFLDTGEDLVAVSGAAGCGTLTQSGILKRTTPAQNINSGSPFTFTDSRNVTTAQITRTGGTLGNTSVAVTSNESPNTPSPCGNHYLNGSPILRWYDISAASAGTATVRLYYRTSNPNETNGTIASAIRIFHCDGTTWTELGGTPGSDGAGEYVEVTGVTTFSPFALAPTGTPTNVDLAAFRAVTTKNQKVRVKWTTSSELTTVGFNVYRAKKYDGNYKKQNTELIPAKHPGELVGDKYKFGNKNVKSGETYFYKLQVVKADGSKEWSEVSQVTIP